MEIPVHILNALKNRKLVFFLGSGISFANGKEKGFPSGWDLTKSLTNRFLGRDPEPYESLSQVAHQVIWSCNGSRHSLNSFWQDVFKDPQVHPLGPHKSLAKLNAPMITTNYDLLIEEAFRQNKSRLSVIYDDKDLVDYEESILIKTHGCISRVENCVITEEDYYRWMAFESEVKNLIRAWFLMYQVVFVGYSLSDINFRQLIVELRRKFGTSFRNCYVVTPYFDDKGYDYKFLQNVIGAQFIKMDAASFLDRLLLELPENFETYTDTDLKSEYFQSNEIAKKSFNTFAAEKIFHKITADSAGSIELSAELVEEIYKIAQNTEPACYKQTPPTGTPDGMIYVPPGEFIMGGARLGNERIRVEKIDHGFYLDECLVTNKEYREFIDWLENEGNHHCCFQDEPPEKDHRPGFEKDYVPPSDVIQKLPEDYFTNPDYDDCPVVLIDWFDAYAFARWKGKRLPTEKEWEKAARGIDGRIFPYGNVYDPSVSNVAEANIYRPTPVKEFESGKSPFGCYDMSGNVWEWCLDTFEYNSSPAKATRVVRGGSCTRGRVKALIPFRNGRLPLERWVSRGFRCAKEL